MLELTGVTRYYGALPAVRDVSVIARPGEVLGYLGPNGSGKSTTVRMVTGLLTPSDGTIAYKGRNIQDHVLRGISIGAQLLFVIALIEIFVYSPVVSTWLADQAVILADTGAVSWLPPL